MEFALILPVFALLFAATLDLGRLFYAQISLTNAAREGAFQGAETPDSYVSGAPCDPDTNVVICRVVLESRNSFTTVAPADVTMSCSPSSCAADLATIVNLRVEGDFTFVTPVLSPFFGGQTITIATEAKAQREVVPTPEPGSATFAPTPTPTATATPVPTPTPTSTTGPPGPTATPTASATPVECLQTGGQPGVYPPNVAGDVSNPNDGDTPDVAASKISAKGLVPIREGDLRGGRYPRNIVQEQSPDYTECVAPGSEVRFKFRP